MELQKLWTGSGSFNRHHEARFCRTCFDLGSAVTGTGRFQGLKVLMDPDLSGSESEPADPSADQNQNLGRLTDVLPAEPAGSSGSVGVQVAVGQVPVLIQPQAPLVVVQKLLPVETGHGAEARSI